MENEFKLTQIAGSDCMKCGESYMGERNGRKMNILKRRGGKISREKPIENRNELIETSIIDIEEF